MARYSRDAPGDGRWHHVDLSKRTLARGGGGKEEMPMAAQGQKKSLDNPDETRDFEQGKLQTATFGDF